MRDLIDEVDSKLGKDGEKALVMADHEGTS